MIDKIVLLAEDDPDHEALLRRAVSQSGIPCRLDVVHDGTEVIEYLFCTGRFADRKSQDPPSLILLDLKMPKMDGHQVLQVLRRVRGNDNTRFAPVVILTCSENDHDIVEAYRLGAQSYLCKPLDYPAFAETVAETLHYWLRLNRSAPKHHLGVYAIHEGL
ncbi:MAG TPA: response regulator [Thermoguttaceae bacterium]|nr:response regulator [Thermoguttaceae bacterium]